jgi:anti-sigma regulatory factor (Ser/Thr protein kinase)
MDYELTLAPVVSSVAAGRRLVRDALTAWHLEQLLDTAALLTSEVVTNSVLHARTDIVLSVVRSAGDIVTISVHDGSTHLPRPRQHTSHSTTGRGLELLDRLSDEWHVDAEPDGKSVVFTVSAGTDPWAAYTGAAWAELETD